MVSKRVIILKTRKWSRGYYKPLSRVSVRLLPGNQQILDTWENIRAENPTYFFPLNRYEEKAMAPHSSTLAWKIPWMEEPGRLQSMGRKESDMTERLHFDFSLSCIGEGNGNPLQYSCLENPMDRGAWWVAVFGVAQSQARLKWLSSSSK